MIFDGGFRIRHPDRPRRCLYIPERSYSTSGIPVIKVAEEKKCLPQVSGVDSLTVSDLVFKGRVTDRKATNEG